MNRAIWLSSIGDRTSLLGQDLGRPPLVPKYRTANAPHPTGPPEIIEPRLAGRAHANRPRALSDTPGGYTRSRGYKEEFIDGQDYVKLESGTGNSDPFALISMTRIPIPGRLINDLRVSLDHADEIIRGLKSG